MEELDITSMLENASLVVFYPQGELEYAVILSHEEEFTDTGCMTKETFLSKWGKLVSPDLLGPNSYLVRYKWIRQGTGYLRVEDLRVQVR